MADGSLSQFKATLARKQARKNKTKGKFERNRLDTKSADSKTEFDFPKLSDTELKELKDKIRVEATSNKRTDLFIFVFLVLVVLCLLIFLN